MPNQELTYFFTGVNGLRTSVPDPKGDSALLCQNMVRHRSPGQLEQADGYAHKFSSGSLYNLPQLDATKDNYLDPAIHLISVLSWKKIANIYVVEHGGASITIAMANYTKGAFFPGGVTANRFGIWARPYWNGAAWVDAWQELTEFYQFEVCDIVDDLGVSTKYYVDAVASPFKYNYAALDPGATVFNASYFLGWRGYVRLKSAEWYMFSVKSCGFDTGLYYIGAPDMGAASAWKNHELLIYRNPHTNDGYSHTGVFGGGLPQSTDPILYKIFNELRISTGNSATDVNLMVGFRQKTWGWANTLRENTIDRLIVESGQNELHAGVGLSMTATQISVGGGGLAPLPTGTYQFQATIIDDLGNESKFLATVSTTISATDKYIQLIAILTGFFDPIVNLRSRYIRLYGSTDGVFFYKVTDLDLTTISGSYALNLDYTIWNNLGAEASTLMDHDVADDCLINYKNAAVIGTHAYATGVYDKSSATNSPNVIFISADNGDGGHEYDTFPNDPIHRINLEYGDGDEIIAVTGVDNKLIVIKRNSVITLAKDNTGAWETLYVEKGTGICSQRSIVSFKDGLFWMDYKGGVSFTTRDSSIFNRAWLRDWLKIHRTMKEGCFAALDLTNQKYRVCVNAKEQVADADNWLEYVLDIPTGEWMIEKLTDMPVDYAIDGRNDTIDFLAHYDDGHGNIKNSIHTLYAGLVHDGVDFSMFYETNQMFPHHLMGIEGMRFNVTVDQIYLIIDSQCDITVSLYSDSSSNAVYSEIIPATFKRYTISVPMYEGTSSFRIRLAATTGIASAKTGVKIAALGVRCKLTESKYESHRLV